MRNPGAAYPDYAALARRSIRATGWRASRRSNSTMSKLLEQGIDAIRELPEENQDFAGEMLLAIAGRGRITLTAEQIEKVKIGFAEADRGEFATDDEMRETWKKFGL